MKTIAGCEFPEDAIEFDNWKPVVARYVFTSTVMAVAKTRVEGKWKAYMASVPGIDHDIEQFEVLSTGTQITEEVARVLFPGFKDIPYAS